MTDNNNPHFVTSQNFHGDNEYIEWLREIKSRYQAVRSRVALQANYGALKKEISKDSLVLIQNPYGNYALQTVLENWDLDDCEEIMSNFYGKCILLSLQKYSSNVIEKCLERSQLFLQNCLREILMNDTSSTFPVLLRNNFGNYVIQTILRCLPNSQIRTTLISEIKRNIECISDKKVTYKWKKIISSL